MSAANILVIDDDPAMLDLTKFHLQEKNCEVFGASSGEEGLSLAAKTSFDLVLTDFNLPDIDGIELVKLIKEVSPDTEIIMVTGYSSVSRAVEAIRAGAFYYIEKPVEFDELLILIDKALERSVQAREISRQAQEISQLRRHLADPASYYDIIGGSKSMQSVYEVIENVAESDANVLILGESGTGKELVASAIHYRSHRAKKPFLQVNCAALPKDLIESELFGHTKGAFTGAAADKLGLIGRASGGSLLLDELAEMPLELQPKLLRVLQERVYYRLGSEKPMAADFRLITSTNRNPSDAIKEGRLREDLYYRVNTIEISIPPLRERREDIQLLADHFLKKYAEKYNRPVLSISQSAYERMLNYHWPGNVRELQNVIERITLICKGDVIEVEHLPFVQNGASASPTSFPTSAVLAASADEDLHPQDNYSIEQLCRMIVGKITEPQPGAPVSELFKQIEVYLAEAALERTNGNKQAAANLLGIYRPRLYNLLRKRGLMTDEQETTDEEQE